MWFQGAFVALCLLSFSDGRSLPTTRSTTKHRRLPPKGMGGGNGGSSGNYGGSYSSGGSSGGYSGGSSGGYSGDSSGGSSGGYSGDSSGGSSSGSDGGSSSGGGNGSSSNGNGNSSSSSSNGNDTSSGGDGDGDSFTGDSTEAGYSNGSDTGSGMGQTVKDYMTDVVQQAGDKVKDTEGKIKDVVSSDDNRSKLALGAIALGATAGVISMVACLLWACGCCRLCCRRKRSGLIKDLDDEAAGVYKLHEPSFSDEGSGIYITPSPDDMEKGATGDYVLHNPTDEERPVTIGLTPSFSVDRVTDNVLTSTPSMPLASNSNNDVNAGDYVLFDTTEDADEKALVGKTTVTKEHGGVKDFISDTGQMQKNDAGVTQDFISQDTTDTKEDTVVDFLSDDPAPSTIKEGEDKEIEEEDKEIKEEEDKEIKEEEDNQIEEEEDKEREEEDEETEEEEDKEREELVGLC